MVGEEGELDLARVDAAMIVRAADPAALQLPCPEQWRSAGLADLTVWVDPLDGTKEYTQVGGDLSRTIKNIQKYFGYKLCMKFGFEDNTKYQNLGPAT